MRGNPGSLRPSARLRYLTARPYSGFANVTLPQGVRPIFVEPFGSRRLSSQTILDLRVSKIFRLGPTGSIEVLVDVLNALNDAEEEGVATRNSIAPTSAWGSTSSHPGAR